MRGSALLLAFALGFGACAAPTAVAPTAAAPTAAASASPAAAKPITVKVGVIGSTINPFQAGNLLGIYKRDGITVEIVEHAGGAQAAAALVGNGVDVFGGDLSHAIRLNGLGERIRVFAATSNRHNYALVAPPGTAPDVKSLKGKKIGITSPGSQTDSAMRWLLRTNGLDPERDVELVAIGGGPPMAAGLASKQIVAGMVEQPLTADLRSKGYVTVFDFVESLPYQGNVMMAKLPWLQANADGVRRFVKAYTEVVRTVRDDAAARQKVVRDVLSTIDPAVADAAGAAIVKSWSADGRISTEGVKNVFEVDRLARNLATNPVPPLESFTDFSYLPQ